MPAYRKPDVEITQVQVSNNVNAVASDLMSGIVGPAYDVVELNDFVYSYQAPTISGSDVYFQVTLSGLDSTMSLDLNSVYAEFIAYNGQVVPFTGTVLTGSVANSVKFKDTGGVIFTNAQLSGSLANYRPRVAYRALYLQRNTEYIIQNNQDIENSVGNFSILNPLGYAASVMLNNSNAMFSVFPVTVVSGQTTLDFSSALSDYTNTAAYAIAILSQSHTNLLAAQVWADSRSLPKNSKPTDIYYSPVITWYSNSQALSGGTNPDWPSELVVAPVGVTYNPVFNFPLDKLNSTDKFYTANQIAASNAQLLDKRVNSVHSDMGWVATTVHVLQTRPGTGYYADTVYGVNGGVCKLNQNVTLANGHSYQAGTIITSAVFNDLVGNTTINGIIVSNLSNYNISVYVPVRGYYYAVQQAALVSRLNPSDPKTSQPVSGVDVVAYSDGFFNSDQLDVIASGGTNIIVQPTISVLPSSRHAITTDMSTIESMSSNIVHQVDVVTINYKSILTTLVGRYKQNPRFFVLLNGDLNTYADLFTKGKDWVSSIKILSVAQNPTSPDHVSVVLRIFPYYAADYIDVVIEY